MTSALCKRKKRLKKGYGDAKKELKAAKDEEEKYKKSLGKVQLNGS
jgi:F0F1-type ATP synthase membrane subunit b/b'